MLTYILRRLLLMIPTLFGVLLLTFAVIQFVPGGPVEQLISQIQGHGTGGEAAGSSSALYQGDSGLDKEKLDKLKALYGFDKPAYQRFFEMLGKFAVFDLGESYIYQQSVTELIISKLPVSVTLGVWTFLITYLICIPLGISKAVRDGSTFDVLSSTFILIGYAIPGFVLGITLLVFLGGGSFWDIFPLKDIISDNWEQLPWYEQILDYLWHITLPLISLAVGSLAVMTMLTKNSFLEEISKQYVLTARAKGLSENKVLYKHVFRNAMIPLVTSFPAAFIGAFFGASLLIETIFSLDGLGLLGYESVVKRDYPVVMGSLYFFTLMFLLTKLLTDILYVVVDPRIQFESVK